VWLARQDSDARVLLTTFSDPLAYALQTRLYRLIHHQPRLAEQIEVHSLDAIALRIGRARFGRLKLAEPARIRAWIAEAAEGVHMTRFTPNFLWEEWLNILDAWQLDTWEACQQVKRLGRKTRLSESQREILWGIYAQVWQKLGEQGLITQAGVYAKLADLYARGERSPFAHVVVDEAQDIDVQQLRFLAALGAGRANGLYFAGDLGQRIFRLPFSWAALGVNVRGRATTLRVNYRTSHQIRRQADRLLQSEIADVDGNVESREGTVSVFNGPEPELRILSTEAEESEFVAEWMQALLEEGFQPPEIGIFVRSDAQLDRARVAVAQAGLSARLPSDPNTEASLRKVTLGTMHVAKGLEFRAVAVMACDDEVIPLQERIENIGDSNDIEEVYNTERHLLYVACTRARDRLLVTSTDPASEFLEDLLVN